MDKPLYTLFKTPTKYYIYDTISDKIIGITEETYMELSTVGFSSKLSNTAKNEIGEINEYGFLKPNYIDAIEHPDKDILDFKLKRQLSSITLQITQQCNLRCTYCAYSGLYTNRVHTGKTMQLETALKCLDFLKENSKDTDNINIGLYGGEPLLHFDLIKKIVEYSNDIFNGKVISYFVTTNGTLFNDKIINFFIENDINLTISLDGNQESHDKNRIFANNSKGTFSLIMEQLKHIKDNYTTYFKKINFNVVLDQSEGFAEINKFFQYNTLFDDNNITVTVISNEYRSDKVSSSEQFDIEWRTELFKVFMSLLGRIDRKNVSNLFVQYIGNIEHRMFNRNSSDLTEVTTHSGPCVPAVNKLFVNVEGEFFPCEKVNENSKIMKIGDIENGFDIENTRLLLNVGNLTESKCKNCWAIRYCNSCVIMADDGEKISEEVKTSRCDEIKNNVTMQFKNYLMLNEQGYDPDIANYLE